MSLDELYSSPRSINKKAKYWKQNIESKITRSSTKLFSFHSQSPYAHIFVPDSWHPSKPLHTGGQRQSLGKVWLFRKMRKRPEGCWRVKACFLSSCVNVLSFHYLFCNCYKNSRFALVFFFSVLFNKLYLANFHNAYVMLLSLLLATWSESLGLHFMHLLSYKCITSSSNHLSAFPKLLSFP